MTTATPSRSEHAQVAAIDESGYGVPFVLRQPHNPAYWLYVVLVVIGVLQFGAQLYQGGTVYPTAAILGLVLWGLYVLPWVWFLRSKDRYETEPAKLALVGFLWGGLVATWVMAIHGNAAILSILTKTISADFAADFGPSISAPIVEESSKGVGVIMLVLLARPLMRSVYDGFILGAFVGLGFQVFENWLYTVSAADVTFGQNQVISSIQIFWSRGIQSGLWSHALYSALVGAGIMYLLVPVERRSVSRGIGLILAGVVLHAVWDMAPVLGFFSVLITIPSALVLILGVERASSRRERHWMHDLMAPEVDRGTITADELDALAGSRKQRRAWLKSHGGHQEHARGKQVLDAATHLAEEIAKARAHETPAVSDARLAVAEARGSSSTDASGWRLLRRRLDGENWPIDQEHG